MTDVIEDDEANNSVMTERVQVLAQGIYDEFQAMVGSFGAESIGNLMPLVVNVLENLDSALADNQDYLTALEETNEENQQLNKQFQKEKQRRKEIEEKAMRLEDLNDLDFRDLRGNISSLNLQNKNLQAKHISQKEQIERLEEKYALINKEKNELHDKHIELIKGQMETMKLNAVAKLAEVRSRSSEDSNAESPVTPHAPGFQDFTSPPKGADSKKKRQLPIAPRRKARAASGEGEDELFLATTPFLRPDSPEFMQGVKDADPFESNYTSFHDEQVEEEEESNGTLEDEDEDPAMRSMGEEFMANEDSLLAELHLATSGSNVPGFDQVLRENESLHTEKNKLTREIDELLVKCRETEAERSVLKNSLVSLQEDKDKVEGRVSELEADLKRLRVELEEEQEKGVSAALEGQVIEGAGGLKLTRLEVARVLRERNEYKEKYLSLLEQIRMSDELSHFKSKTKKSRWVDYFAAVFSPSKRRQLEQTLVDATPRRAILSRPGGGVDEEDGGFPQAGAAGYRNTDVIPVLKKTGKRQDEMYMTSVSWVIPNMDHVILEDNSLHPQPNTPNINTCRPMSFQEDGAKILCASSVNLAIFVDDCNKAFSVPRDATSSSSTDKASISIIWIVTGVPNLTKVSVIDVSAVGEVLDTFPICASPISCIASVPEFDSRDPEIIAGLSDSRRKPQSSLEQQPDPSNDRPSSSQATMWMGSDSGVLYVHSAVSQWKKCIHADKLPAPIIDITHFKGKGFVLLQNSNLAIFKRFPDGDWDWDSYSLMVLTQRRDVPASAIAAIKYNVWCAVGNTVHVVQSYQFKMEATFQVHQAKNAVVTKMLGVGEGVWISFKMDSTLRLFNASSFTHMQDLDIAPSVHRLLVFGSEKRSPQMPIQISTLIAAHSSLWVGTENGVLVSYPFTAPAVVAEESGWELIKEAEVGGQTLPEPFDVWTEEGLEAGALAAEAGLETSHDSGRSSGERSLSQSVTESPLPSKPHPPRASKLFNPFCNVDQVELSIHCHINAVKSLLSVPGMVQRDLSVYEPLGGVYIGSGEENQRKPTLFVVSCGEGHLDLRTADKVLQTLQAEESGQSGLPSPATIISDKNYIMVWDINTN